MSVAPTPIHPRRAPHRRRQLPVVAVVIVALLALAVVLLLRFDVFGSSSSSPERGSGVAATETREVASFGAVELPGSNNVTIRVGEKQAVVVHADDNLLDHATTEVRAGNLVIGNTSGGFETNNPMSVEVSVPSLGAVSLTGSGDVSISGIDSQDLTVLLSGSGVLKGSGTATQLDVTLSGSGDVQLEQLIANDVHAVVIGSGRILVTATQSLDAAVPGSGVIVYSGNPKEVATAITGSGTIRAK
jgi:Putative auto-transporter adhesin, head GIN domain